MSPEIYPSDPRDSVCPYHFKDREKSLKEGAGPTALRHGVDRAGFALSSKDLQCPEGGLRSMGIPVGLRDTELTVARWLALSWPAGCSNLLFSCLPACRSAPALSPRALEGAVSLSGRARLSSSYAPAQLWEPDWRPAGGGGVSRKGLPGFSVPVSSAHAIRQWNEAGGST